MAVIGGGPAGSLCALRLARFGRRVLLADASFPHPPSLAIPEMLAPEGVWLLEWLGLSTVLDGPGSAACQGILSDWDPDGPEFSDLTLTRLRSGRIVDRRQLDSKLRECAAGAGVDVGHSARVRFLGPRGAAPVLLRLTLPADEDERVVTASFVAEATGRRAAPGVAADDAGRRIYFDRLVALPVREPIGPRVGGLLRIAPSRSGWWYSLAPGGVGGVAVYLTDADLLPREPAALARHLERASSEVAGVIGPISIDALSPRASLIRDARTTCRRALWRERWLPIGDSAFTLDPLSGSGLTRALQMADQAALAIEDYLATGECNGLRQLAVSFSAEFAAAQEVRQRVYLQCAQRFPESDFWRRRGRRISSVVRRGDECAHRQQ